MTNMVALLIHNLLDIPERWSVKDGVLSDGYHRLNIDASRYAMGEASYMPTQTDSENLRKAISYWKAETGWRPPVPPEEQPAAVKSTAGISFDDALRNVYDKFVQSVRNNLKSFQIHGDSHILNLGLTKALSEVDEVLTPIRIPKRRTPDANDSGASGS